MTAPVEDNDEYFIVEKYGTIYVHHGYCETGPFSSVRKAEKYIAEACQPKPKETVLAVYSSKGVRIV